MKRLRWIPVAVLLLGLAEFFVLIGVAQLVGLPLAILIMLGLSLVGGVLLRSEGLRAWRRLRAAQRSGGPVGDGVLDGAVGLLAGVLFLIPGYLSALAGLLLFIPPVRELVRTRMRGATERRVPSQMAGDLFGPRTVKVQKTSPTRSGDEVIEGEIVD